MTGMFDRQPPTHPGAGMHKPPIDEALNLRAIDVAAVQAMLAKLFPDARVRAVEVLERARCDDGIASTADRIALQVQFEPPSDAGLPSRMILKTLLLHPLLRFGLPATLGEAEKTRIKTADRISAWFEATRIAGFSKSPTGNIIRGKNSRRMPNST